jgi:isopentenyl phosphate kinase
MTTRPASGAASTDVDPTALLVLKVGGSLVSDKSRTRHMDWEALDAYAALAADLFRAHRGRMALVVGGGSYGHGAVRGLDPDDSFGLLDLTEAMFAVKWAWARALRAHGIRAMPVQLTAMCRVVSGVPQGSTDVLDRLLDHASLPVLSGDCILDEQGELALTSSDEVPGMLVDLDRGTLPARIVVLTDVAGVLLDGPDGSQVVPWLDAEHPEQWSSLLWPAQEWDVSGAMAGKVRALTRAAMSGAECVIMEGDVAMTDFRFMLDPVDRWPDSLPKTVIGRGSGWAH